MILITLQASAEEAIQRMQGTMIGQQAVHLSWGRSPTAKQVEGSQEMASMAGAVPAVEQRDEYDPLAMPDVDKLNAAYLAVHGSAIFGRPMWQRTSSLTASIGSYGSTYFICRSLIGVWCANVMERKTIISKKTPVPEGNPGKFCFCT
ncbi:Polyadenylate-binding protein RBP47B' [Camellia lanceoleosa]|uniref:Polyadenylate-binding protein RBP47B n=1 Tax=Camellia lanceoleosa TaxID=1840588 RepID=A0ACC0GIV2_9ERIC|nr:Polyadenylate-binding protein RBP47B' [Camellia lanceoleosa]